MDPSDQPLLLWNPSSPLRELSQPAVHARQSSVSAASSALPLGPLDECAFLSRTLLSENDDGDAIYLVEMAGQQGGKQKRIYKEIRVPPLVDGMLASPRSCRRLLQGVTELCVLSHLTASHACPHIIRQHEVGYGEQQGCLQLLLDYAECGELFQLLAEETSFSEDISRYFGRQLLCAVACMHESGVVHRDISLENLVLRPNGTLQLIDFGQASWRKESSAHTHTSEERIFTDLCGKPSYRPPEVWEGLPYTGGPVDVFACGVALFAMATGAIPWAAGSLDDPTYSYLASNGFSALVERLEPELPALASVSPAMLAFLEACLHPDPALRPPATELLKHPWLKNAPLVAPLSLSLPIRPASGPSDRFGSSTNTFASMTSLEAPTLQRCVTSRDLAASPTLLHLHRAEPRVCAPLCPSGPQSCQASPKNRFVHPCLAASFDPCLDSPPCAGPLPDPHCGCCDLPRLSFSLPAGIALASEDPLLPPPDHLNTARSSSTLASSPRPCTHLTGSIAESDCGSFYSPRPDSRVYSPLASARRHTMHSASALAPADSLLRQVLGAPNCRVLSSLANSPASQFAAAMGRQRGLSTASQRSSAVSRRGTDARLSALTSPRHCSCEPPVTTQGGAAWMSPPLRGTVSPRKAFEVATPSPPTHTDTPRAAGGLCLGLPGVSPRGGEGERGGVVMPAGFGRVRGF